MMFINNKFAIVKSAYKGNKRGGKPLVKGNPLNVAHVNGMNKSTKRFIAANNNHPIFFEGKAATKNSNGSPNFEVCVKGMHVVFVWLFSVCVCDLDRAFDH